MQISNSINCYKVVPGGSNRNTGGSRKVVPLYIRSSSIVVVLLEVLEEVEVTAGGSSGSRRVKK